LSVTADFGFEVANGDIGQEFVGSDYVLSLSGDNASLSLGDLDPVAEDREGFVDGSTTAGFNDQDVHFDVVDFDAMLVGEATVAGFTAAVSFGVNGDDTLAAGVEDLDAMQLHVAGTVSIVDLELAYQQEVAGTPEIFGVGASVNVAGADLEASYVDDGTENSIGLAVAYPFGPVAVSAYYSINDVAEDNFGAELDYSANNLAINAFVDVNAGEDGADDVTEYGIEGSYDVGNGLEVFAGYITDDAAENDLLYAAAEYDLGGGAMVTFSYADDGDSTANLTGDEVGDPEYNEGISVIASFEF